MESIYRGMREFTILIGFTIVFNIVAIVIIKSAPKAQNVDDMNNLVLNHIVHVPVKAIIIALLAAIISGVAVFISGKKAAHHFNYEEHREALITVGLGLLPLSLLMYVPSITIEWFSLFFILALFVLIWIYFPSKK